MVLDGANVKDDVYWLILNHLRTVEGQLPEVDQLRDLGCEGVSAVLVREVPEVDGLVATEVHRDQLAGVRRGKSSPIAGSRSIRSLPAFIVGVAIKP